MTGGDLGRERAQHLLRTDVVFATLVRTLEDVLRHQPAELVHCAVELANERVEQDLREDLKRERRRHFESPKRLEVRRGALVSIPMQFLEEVPLEYGVWQGKHEMEPTPDAVVGPPAVEVSIGPLTAESVHARVQGMVEREVKRIGEAMGIPVSAAPAPTPAPADARDRFDAFLASLMAPQPGTPPG